MAKYVMRSFYGNEIKEVNSERKRDELIELGFTEIKEATTEARSIEKMKVSEIEVIAESNGIDLSDCKNREEKISKIRESINYK